MTYTELVEAVTRLPTDERLRLLETIAHSLRAELPEVSARRGRPAAEVLGLFSTGGPPPTDEEIRELYTDYLVEKYG